MIRSLTSVLLLAILPQTVLRVDVQLQQIVVTVRDEQDRLVNNLKPEDLIVEENGVPQKIVHFVQDSETPISLGVLIDTSGSMAAVPAGTISALRAAVGSTRVLMQSMKPTDEFLLMSFSDTFSTRQAFTQDRAKIEAAMRKLTAAGSTNLFTSVERALQEVKKAHYKKKALIIITDGLADGNYSALQRAIRDSEVLIYTFGIQGGGGGFAMARGGFGRGPIWAPTSGDPSRRVLDVLSSESGGQSEMFDLGSAELINRMVAFVGEIAAELRGQYTIGYYPQDSGPSASHSIRVRAKSPQYRARIRRDVLEQ